MGWRPSAEWRGEPQVRIWEGVRDVKVVEEARRVVGVERGGKVIVDCGEEVRREEKEGKE